MTWRPVRKAIRGCPQVLKTAAEIGHLSCLRKLAPAYARYCGTLFSGSNTLLGHADRPILAQRLSLERKELVPCK